MAKHEMEEEEMDGISQLAFVPTSRRIPEP